MATDTIPLRLQEQAKKQPDAPAYHERTDAGWKTSDYRTYADQVCQAARALIALGFKPGERVSILGFNRPEWVIFDLGAMSAGGAPAGIYTTSSPEEVRYIVHHSESPFVLVEDQTQWEKIKQRRAEMPLLKRVITMRGAPKIDDPLVMSWNEFLAEGAKATAADVYARIEGLTGNGLATLIYTSGTTGPPKGVMLSHHNLAWTAATARDLVGGQPTDTTLSYLPLSHIAEQMFSIHGPITMGSSIYFAQSIEKVLDNLKEVQPTIVFGVPRIWEKFHAGISARLKGATGVKKALAEWARGVATRVTAEKAAGRSPGGLLAAQYALANKLVFSKLKPAIGLGRARFCVSGAAPIAKEVLEFFASLDIVVLEVYGQSEDCGPTSFNLPHRFKLGTVGYPIPGDDVRIADDGEILVRGPNVFLGYFKDPQATAETLVGGWLHTGDLGAFDEEGFLTITGRKKEIIITAGGKNIAPKNIEAALTNHELIGQAIVIGDRRKFLTALLTLEPEAAVRFANRVGIPDKNLHAHPLIVAEVRRAVDEANRHFARVEQVKKFRILPRQFSIEEGELTPTLKIRRRVVQEHFVREIDAMYADAEGAEEEQIAI